MRIKHLIIYFIISLFSAAAQAEEYHHYLTVGQIDRVRSLNGLLDGVDHQTVLQTIKELEKSHYPEINLEIKEAEAHAFMDIVQQESVQGQHKKQWLYSMVCLNMAYLQFGSDPNSAGTDLNRLICQKLKEYLPSGFLKQSGVLYSL